MEYEKYYKIEADGNFTIHFRNSKKFSVERIKEIFSAHGNVLAVNTTKEIHGLRFVKFKTLEEVSRSVEAFKNSDIIKILPQRKNLNEKADKRYSKQQQIRKIANDDLFSPLSHTSNQEINHDHNNDSPSDTCSQGSRHRYRLNIIEHNKSNSLVSDSLHARQNYNNGKPFASNDNLGIMKKFHIDNYMNNGMIGYDKIPALISKSNIQDKEFNSVSDHSSWNETKVSSKAEIVPMQEVIVANIHENYGVHYILHLFEKYNPISATLIKKIPETSVRYCHVYFKTPQDATAVEEKFDNFYLSKKNLIVLRKLRLIEVATLY